MFAHANIYKKIIGLQIVNRLFYDMGILAVVYRKSILYPQ